MRDTKRILASVLLTFALAALVFGQGAQTGGITGLVKDASGATVQNAKVEIYNEETGRLERTVNTGEDGNFAVTLLPPGNYRLQITAAGFKQYRATSVSVRINETTRQDVDLTVGAVEEIVQIEAAPNLINTANATTGQPVDARTLSALPLPVPNFLFLLTLSAGTAGEPPDVRAANRGIVDINVNGQRTSNNSVALEGINVNDFNLAHFDTVPLPNTNVIQEFKVATSLYDATLGSKGGGAVSLVLKSGTKDFHGQAYWSHRNDALNANEWFRNSTASNRRSGETEASKARLLQNVVGASGSGPFPFVGGFWFANFQAVRARNGLDPLGASLRPTIQSFPRNADGTTSAALLASGFGLTEAEIDPVAVNILNLKNNLFGSQYLIPRPGDPGCQNPAGPNPAGTNPSFTCTISGIAPLTDNQYTISYDRTFREGNDKITGRWFWDNGNVVKPYGTAGTLANPRTDIQRNRFFTLSETHVFSPRMVNEFRFGFSRFISSFAPTDSINLSDVGASRPNSGDIPGLYFFNVTGLFSFGTGVNDDRGTVSNQFQFHDTWSLTLSKHTLRAGGELSRYQLNRFNRFAVRGSLTFGAITGTPIDTSFKSFITGRATAVQSGAGDPQRYFRATDIAAFVQDDWRIHPRVTLNLGLRWEGLGFSRELRNRLGNYDPSLLYKNPNANPFIFPEDTNLDGFTGTPGVPGCVLNSCFDANNFAPRVSFAWDVLGNQKTVVRGGYGFYYQRLSNQNILQANLAPPFNVQGLENRATGDPAKVLANPFPSTPSSGLIAQNLIPQASRFAGVVGNINTAAGLPIFVNDRGERCNLFAGDGGTAPNCSISLASFTAPPLDFRAPYSQQWNLSVQRELFRSLAIEVGYVGSHYVGGLGIYNPYQARLASPENPIQVTDINGVTHTITVNTPNNEPLRHEVLGLSGRLGARFSAGIGHATYHSGQFTVSRRFQNGLFFQGAYTFSKSIDNVSGSQSTDELNATRNGQGGANLFNFGTKTPQLNRALGDFDRPHRFIFSYTWEVPVPKQGFLGSQLFQGWSIGGIVTYQSGLPFTPTVTGGGAFGGQGTTTPMLICAATTDQISTLPTCAPGTASDPQLALTTGNIQDRLNNYINPNFFLVPRIVPNGVTGATEYGNVPRNIFRGPFQQNWDFSLGKRISLFERHAIQFRAEFFNLFNHPVFRAPNSVNLNNRSTFGQITETAIPARLVQFALKYDF